jgi:hypothetical protein
MIALIVAIAAVMTPFLLWGIFAPRSQWMALQAWKYRHPRVNEPSDAAYGVGRVVNVIQLVVMLGAGWYLIRDTMATERERPARRPPRRRCGWPHRSVAAACSKPLRA